MSIRFRAASSNLSPAAIAAIRKVCDLSIETLRTRAARAEWLFEIEVFAGEWPHSKPRLVRLLKDIQSGILPLTVSESSDADDEDDPLSIEEAFARIQFFRDIELEQGMVSQLEAGYISTREEYEPPGEDEANSRPSDAGVRAQMKVVAQESWAWTLYGDESGALYLSVLCGTIALFTVDFKLDEHEVSTFRAAGDSAVQELADRVRSEPSKHLARHIDNFKPTVSLE